MKQTNENRGLRNSGRVVLAFFTVLFFSFFVAIAVSFAMIAETGVARGENLFELALQTYLFPGTVFARRGTITDRNGRVIADQHPSYTMFAVFYTGWDRSVVTDIEGTAEALAGVLDASVEEFITFLSPEDENTRQVNFGPVGQRLSFTQRNEILALELPGIYFQDALTRFYPNGVFASHTIGYTMFGEYGELIGVMGLEGYFNEMLTGQDGIYQFLGDRYGMLQPNQERMFIHDPVDGYNIMLTLDERIQLFVEAALDNTLEIAEETDMDIQSMVAVVMDVRTGEILAAASRPTFDPNTREVVGGYINPLGYPFEPGSTIKVATFAAAIDTGNYRGDQMFTSGARSVPGNITIHDWNQSWGNISFDDGFLVSSNTAVVDMFRYWLSFDNWMSYLAGFGFGETVDLPIVGELPGQVPDEETAEVDVLMSGFGQGPMTVTPVQQLQALTAILNEGNLIRPQLIYQIYDPNTSSIVESFEPDIVGQPISAETARQVQDLMIDVVESPIGTGRNLYYLDVPSGGKTGTAQLFDRETGTYHPDFFVYSYIGFAPAEDPEIMMFVAVQGAPGSRDGHSYPSEIYQFVMNHTLHYLGLGAGTSNAEFDLSYFERTLVPNVMNLPIAEAETIIREARLTPIIIGGNERVFGQSPAADVAIIIGDKVFLRTDVVDQLPDFTGWNRAQIATYGELLELNIEFVGHGVATNQSIRAGRTVQAGSHITITLE
ncbi:MAG: penicillin-binding protein [Turicibacter sp.]|nr:penicillin-binding protein [Turicibacter sp.]